MSIDDDYRPCPIHVTRLGADEWQASQVFYPFGANPGPNGEPDQEPGFRECEFGFTARSAVVNLMDAIDKRQGRRRWKHL